MRGEAAALDLREDTAMRRLLSRTFAVLLAGGLGLAALAPSTAEARDRVRVTVGVGDVYFGYGRPYYRYTREPLYVDYYYGRPRYYRYIVQPIYYAPPPRYYYSPRYYPRYRYYPRHYYGYPRYGYRYYDRRGWRDRHHRHHHGWR